MSTKFVSDLTRMYEQLPEKQKVRMLCELTSFVTKASKSTLNINMFDNYNHRTIQVYECLSRHHLIDNLTMNTRRTGKDAWCDRFENIEIKTSQNKYGMFLFDKQNNDIRRQQIFEYDAFAFAIFKDELLTQCVFVHEPESIVSIRAMFVDKQSEFVEKSKHAAEQGKRGYDTISLTLKDLDTIPHDIFYKSVDTWNHFKNKTSEF